MYIYVWIYTHGLLLLLLLHILASAHSNLEYLPGSSIIVRLQNLEIHQLKYKLHAVSFV